METKKLLKDNSKVPDYGLETRSKKWGEVSDEPSKSSYASVNIRSEGISEGLQGYNSPLNILLIFVPLGITAGILGWSSTWVFTCNFFAIMPLAVILGRATEDIAVYLNNDTIGGLLNATFGNAVELILSINALRAGLYDVVKSTLVGSILSNLLLVLGCSFLAGGVVYREQYVNPAVAEANGNILQVATFAITVPTIYAYTAGKQSTRENIQSVSMISAIILLLLYAFYLFYQLYTHYDMFEEDDVEDGEQDDEPVASGPVAFTILLVSCVVVAICSDYIVDSVEEFSSMMHLSPTFVAIILLPIIGNAAEHFSAVTVAMKDKLDLSIGIACGSSVQIAVFVTPFMVVISSFLGPPDVGIMTLQFGLSETVILILSVIIVNMSLRDGKTNWLEGTILLGAYVIAGGAFWYI